MPETDKNIAEIREWLVEINTNQKHQTKILEVMQNQSAEALSIARSAEEKGNRAINKSDRNHKNLEDYKIAQDLEKKWAIRTVILLGTAGITVVLFLVPILASYYIN